MGVGIPYIINSFDYMEGVNGMEGLRLANVTTEYLEAKKAYEHAWQNFNNADPDYMDAAIFELKAAEERMQKIMGEELTSEERMARKPLAFKWLQPQAMGGQAHV